MLLTEIWETCSIFIVFILIVFLSEMAIFGMTMTMTLSLFAHLRL